MNFEQARFNMIEQQIRPWDVLDQDVLTLLSLVRREDFVPAAWVESAFADIAIPLVEGASAGRAMLEPKVEARLLQELRVAPEDRALEIGTGSGYFAALLAHRARQVQTIEIDPALAATATAKLRRAGVVNVNVIPGDGATGLVTAAPFDVIVLSGSVAQVPPALLDQLKVGGRLVAIVGHAPVMRAMLHTRIDAQHWRQTVLFDTVAPRLLGFPEPSTFKF